jgi:uncharacterized protein
MKLTKEVILKEIEKRKNEIKEKFNVKNLFLYGSYVDNTQKETSDIDLIAEFNFKIEDLTDLDLQTYLYKVFKKDVSIGQREEIHPLFKQSIEGGMIKCL